jgi:succinate-semialdehyde dehydrogenase / glutarate-semialdehyde dehydrogenase
MADLRQLDTAVAAALEVASDYAARYRAATFPVISPIDGSEITAVPDLGSTEAEAAADRVSAAFQSWRRTTAYERAAVLRGWFELIQAHREALAQLITLEMGKPITQARYEVDYAAAFVELYAEEAKRLEGEILQSRHANQRILVTRHPVGPAFGITPWNFPAAMVTRSAAPALAAACTMALKPAEQTPLTALVLAAWWEEAGGPADAFQVLPCLHPAPLAGVFLADRRFRQLTFTGSHAVGQHLYRQASDTLKRLSLELGGNAPFVVCEDADLESAARQTLGCKFRISGQSCVCANRIYVHERVADEFAEIFSGLVAALRLGDPRDEATDVGPLIDGQGLAKVQAHLDDARDRGARLLAGGGARDGLYFEPTVLGDVPAGARILDEETFGPIAPLLRFSSDTQAIALANETPFGLAAYVWTRDLARAFRYADELEAGIVGVNEGVPGGAAQVPFGGFKESGIGRVGGRWGIEEFLEVRYVCITLPGAR